MFIFIKCFLKFHRKWGRSGLRIKYFSTKSSCLQTPVREHEIIIFSSYPGTDLFRLFYYVIQTYYHKLERMCFSTGLAFPVLCSRGKSGSLPAIIRIGTRGQCNSLTSDVSSLELYVVCNILICPFACP